MSLPSLIYVLFLFENKILEIKIEIVIEVANYIKLLGFITIIKNEAISNDQSFLVLFALYFIMQYISSLVLKILLDRKCRVHTHYWNRREKVQSCHTKITDYLTSERLHVMHLFEVR